jgi:hypothetical protein
MNFEPTDLKADRIFYVLVDSDGSSGCTVRVVPENGGPTQVEAGWKVAWWLVNRCPAAPNSLTLEFFIKAGSIRKEPVTFRDFANGILEGKVKKRPWYSGKRCQEFEEAPCGEYKYNVVVGPYRLDPDFEIVVY